MQVSSRCKSRIYRLCKERVVEEEVQNLRVERMIPPIGFKRGRLRSQIILSEEIL